MRILISQHENISGTDVIAPRRNNLEQKFPFDAPFRRDSRRYGRYKLVWCKTDTISRTSAHGAYFSFSARRISGNKWSS